MIPCMVAKAKRKVRSGRFIWRAVRNAGVWEIYDTVEKKTVEEYDSRSWAKAECDAMNGKVSLPPEYQ